MKHKENYILKTFDLIKDLKKQYPNWEISRHISGAVDGEQLWGLSDKALYEALDKYSKELAIDEYRTEDIDAIIRDGMALDNMMSEDDE